MPFFDLPIDELYVYNPTFEPPTDFDSFWDMTLAETRQHPLAPEFTPVDMGLQTLDVFDVSFTGFAGARIKGWFMLPRGATTPLGCVVEFIGYGGGRGLPLDWLPFPSAGLAYFVMDTRGQGSVWLDGDTPDPGLGANPAHPGFMTQGILDPQTYYFRRVFADAVRAVEAARTHPAVDPTRVAVTGRSQGGGITLAVSALVPDVVLAMSDVPFLCHFQRALALCDVYPYKEIAGYLAIHRDHIERVYKTLSYFDGVHFARRAQTKALFSVGLMDLICPPSTVFAAYNAWGGEKDIKVYAYNGHEGGGTYQMQEKIRLARQSLLQ
ncbi:MAG: acetylxylan esterase [Anaerolineales bacterium]